MTPPIRQGRIVWVEMLDPQGRNPKVRPAVVMTATSEIRDEGIIAVVAVTSQTHEAPAESSVSLPWQNGGHPKTKLTRPSAAVCTWSQFVPVANIQGIAGMVPFHEMSRIVAIYQDVLKSDDELESEDS